MKRPQQVMHSGDGLPDGMQLQQGTRPVREEKPSTH
jgi:hypothetical protein